MMIIACLFLFFVRLARTQGTEDGTLVLEYSEYSEWSGKIVLYFPNQLKTKEFQNSPIFTFSMKDKHGDNFPSFEVLSFKNGVSDQVL